MRNWKELGEVPDSEDDDDVFDSQDSLHHVPLAEATAKFNDEEHKRDHVWDVPSSQEEDPLIADHGRVRSAKAISIPRVRPELRKAAPGQDIWDIPSSSQEADELANDVEPLHRPASTAALSQVLGDEIWEIPSSPDQGNTTLKSAPEPTSPVEEATSHSAISSSPLSSIDSIVFRESDGSGSNDRHDRILEGNSLKRTTMSYGVRSGSAPATAELFAVEGQGNDGNRPPDDHLARQSAIRYERSLRARKPIQEHPFLFEMAQYNNVMKQHGVQPVRLYNKPDALKEIQATGSGDDKEYTEPESQESGPAGRSFDPFDDQPLNVLPSSPLASSPAEDVPRMFNRYSPTSFDDVENLPPLENLDSLTISTRKAKSKRPASSPRTSSTQKRHRSTAKDNVSGRRQSPFPTTESNRMELSCSPVPDIARLVDMGAQAQDDLSQDRSAVARPNMRMSNQPVSADAEPRPARIISDDSDSDAPTIIASTSKSRLVIDTSSGTDSESSDGTQNIVHNVKRRIRGVLPASWLRLDQKSVRTNLRKASSNHTIPRSPGEQPKRGVAVLKKRGGAQLPSQGIPSWDDESDEEPATAQQPTSDETFNHQTTLSLDRHTAPSPLDQANLNTSDEDVLDISQEESQIDHMLAPRARKTQNADVSGRRTGTLRKTASVNQATPGPLRRQPRITDAMGIARKDTASSNGVRGVRKRTRKRNRSSASTGRTIRRHAVKQAPAPRLSILDVITPDAPAFLKIAARTARGRQDGGRTSPKHRFIQLATREDQMDSMAVLQEWKAGKIRQRKLPPPAPARKAEARRIIGHPTIRPQLTVSISSTSKRRQQSTSNPFSSVKHHSLRDIVVSKNKPDVLDRGAAKTPTRGLNLSRPAQLEAEANGANGRTLHSFKNTLDRLFSRNPQMGMANHPTRTGAAVDSIDVVMGISRPAESRLPLAPQSPNRAPFSQVKPRHRKQQRPVHIDIDAPQYKHAQDPVPERSGSPITLPIGPAATTSKSQLEGLGPYGTQYSHHFEVFPMISGVYFHESTLMGSGFFHNLERENLGSHRTDAMAPVSLLFGEQLLHWGAWSAETSSQFGILMDTLAESGDHASAEADMDSSKAVGAADFILLYIHRHIWFGQSSDLNVFVARFRETLRNFTTKFSRENASDDRMEQSQRVLERLLAAVLCVLLTCRKEPALASEQFALEDNLRGLVKITADLLMKRGIGRLRDVYKEQSLRHARETGLRETSAIHTWVVIMQTVEKANIPRASFWDILQSHIGSPDLLTSARADNFEKIWESMFLLLPLTDFNHSGLIDPHCRRKELQDGWGLPQKLLKPVFQLYQENPRQSPSFNDYCRALIARCHWLADQWDWRRSSAIVGLVFDFFGTQRLGNLRNEEVYKSPTFLESLATRPDLEIESEDRCFHLFLKLIGLSIRRLRDIHATKDIRNLVTRTIPNHVRTHSKDQDFEERELAALRNHHDLLCTLFWACPPDLRPSPALLEGLVDPATSHKEACLVNIRAWSQLARFVVANGEATTTLKAFNKWRHTFFDQLLRQYDTVASDVNQQLYAMPKEQRQGFSQSYIDSMISENRSQIQDIIRLAMTASFDVLQHCPDLASATFAWSPVQLQKIFEQFSTAPFGMSLGILDVAIRTLGDFMARIEVFKNEEESQGGESQELESAQASDALETLEHYVTRSYFSMARCVLSSSEMSQIDSVDHIQRTTRVEMIITQAAKIAWHSGAVTELFKYGKFGLFTDRLLNLDKAHREALVSCVATLLKCGMDDLVDLDFSLVDLWATSLVRPRGSLGRLDALAQELRRLRKEFMPDHTICSASRFDYQGNRDRFESLLQYMRKSLRRAGPSLRKILLSEHKKTITMVMDQIPNDLDLVSSDPSQHAAFITFVRRIISLIKSHASDFCTIPDFYYHTSQHYSPPMEDPTMMMSTLRSYALRLEENEGQRDAVEAQLSYFLINTSKEALVGETPEALVSMISRALEIPVFRRFMTNKMIPGVLKAAFSNAGALPMSHIFLRGLQSFLETDDFPPILQPNEMEMLHRVAREIIWLITTAAGSVATASNLNDNTTTHSSSHFIVVEMSDIQYDSSASVSSERLEVLSHAIRVLHALRLSLIKKLGSGTSVLPPSAVPEDNPQQLAVLWCIDLCFEKMLRETGKTYDFITLPAMENFRQRLEADGFQHAARGMFPPPDRTHRADVSRIASVILQDVATNWEASVMHRPVALLLWKVRTPGQVERECTLEASTDETILAQLQVWMKWYMNNFV